MCGVAALLLSILVLVQSGEVIQHGPSLPRSLHPPSIHPSVHPSIHHPSIIRSFMAAHVHLPQRIPQNTRVPLAVCRPPLCQKGAQVPPGGGVRAPGSGRAWPCRTEAPFPCLLQPCPAPPFSHSIYNSAWHTVNSIND